MYWLPKIYKTLVGVRFVVASYYCSTNPLSDTIPKMIFNTVESLLYSGCNKSWVGQNSFPIATMSNKNNVKKKSISTFDCAPYIQPSYINFSYKFLQKLSIFSSNLNSENALASLKHLSLVF